MQSLSIGFSSCPNDTFMFDALANRKLQTDGIEIVPHIHDVEQLNRLAQEGLFDITKISFGNYPLVSREYEILSSGSAIGNGCGPLLVSKNEVPLDLVDTLSIAIPGKFTTAGLLLGIFFPKAKRITEMIFSDIEQSVLSGKTDAGLVIHENRFTYSNRGLKKIADMGELWEKSTGLPIPLGCIVIRRNLSQTIKQHMEGLIRESIETALAAPDQTMDYVRTYAREMDDTVMKKHIALYVNKFSLDLGSEGKNAIELLFRKGQENGLLNPATYSIFL